MIMNKMMLKMMADFIGLSSDDLKQMALDGQEAAMQMLAIAKTVDDRLARIEKHLGIKQTNTVTVELGEIDNAEG